MAKSYAKTSAERRNLDPRRTSLVVVARSRFGWMPTVGSGVRLYCQCCTAPDYEAAGEYADLAVSYHLDGASSTNRRGSERKAWGMAIVERNFGRAQNLNQTRNDLQNLMLVLRGS